MPYRLSILTLVLFFSLVSPLSAALPDLEALEASKLEKKLSPLYEAPIKLYTSGKFKEALRELARIAKTQKRFRPNYEYYFLMSLGHIGLEDWNAAKADLEKAIGLRGSDGDLRYYLAWLNLRDRQANSAEQHLRDALWFKRFELVPLGLVYILQGQAYELNKQAAKAELSYNAALATSPVPPAAILALVEFYSTQGRSAELLSLLQTKALETSLDAPTKIKLAQELLKGPANVNNEFNQRKAFELLSEIIKPLSSPERYTNPAFPLFLQAAWRIGEKTLAQAELHAALELNPTDAELLKFSKHINPTQLNSER